MNDMMTFQIHSDFIILKHARLRFQFWNLYFHIFHFQYSLSPKIPFSISTNTLPQHRHCLRGNYQLVLDVSVFCWMHLCVVFTATQTTSAMLCFPRANLVFLQPTKYLHLAPSNIHKSAFHSVILRDRPQII